MSKIKNIGENNNKTSAETNFLDWLLRLNAGGKKRNRYIVLLSTTCFDSYLLATRYKFSDIERETTHIEKKLREKTKGKQDGERERENNENVDINIKSERGRMLKIK